VANEPRFADTPPARIVPALADEGIYIASASSFHRMLREQGQMNRRGRAQPPRPSRPPTTHIATGPAEVWCWDMTFLPAQIQGRWFYLYLILDLYSRKIVGFEVHDTDSADHAAHLARRTALAEGVHAMPARPVLHGDNGATLKATTVLAMLHWLGIKPSYSRPRVSDDNAFAEALFRTVKYRPEFPALILLCHFLILFSDHSLQAAGASWQALDKTNRETAADRGDRVRHMALRADKRRPLAGSLGVTQAP
jgi:putative transposase